MSIASFVTEIRAAEEAGDEPRRNRAMFALRLLHGMSLVEPCSKTRYDAYRPTDSDFTSAVALEIELCKSM